MTSDDDETRPRTRSEIRKASRLELVTAIEADDWRYRPASIRPDELIYGRGDQLYRSDLATMSSDQIEAARLSGQLDDVQAGRVRPPDLGGDAA